MADSKSSSLLESGNATRGLRPPVGDPAYAARSPRPAGCNVAVEPPQQLVTAVPVALGDHLDPAIGQVLGIAGQSELKRVCAHPPAEPDSLHAALHPRGQPHCYIPGGHRFPWGHPRPRWPGTPCGTIAFHVTTGRFAAVADSAGRCRTTGS